MTETDIPLVVYTCGMVGSRAIEDALKSTYPGPVFHYHYLNPESLARIEEIWRWLGDAPKHHHAAAKKFFDEYILARQPVRFVSLVRDPMERTLSARYRGLGERVEKIYGGWRRVGRGYFLRRIARELTGIGVNRPTHE